VSITPKLPEGPLKQKKIRQGAREMFLNYLLTALYNLKRQPVFSAIKVLSLAIGLGCSILVIMHVQYARSFDKHFPNWENTYRVVTSITLDFRMNTEVTNDAAPHKMRLDYPQIEHMAMISPNSGVFSRSAGGASSANAFYFADSEFIEIFAPKFISGDPATALNEPFSMVLDETTAKKYFADEEPLGQTLTMQQFEVKVTGVIQDMPKNTHLPFQMLVSIATGRQVAGETFMNNTFWNGFGGTRTYIQVPDKAAADAISADLPAFLERNLPDDQKGYAQRTNQTLSLEPLGDIYLSPRQGFGQSTNNRGKIMTGLALFAGLILLTSCINFANLSFSQIRQRGKEIGIRKTLGAKRRDIVLQFLLESLLLTLFALCLALPLVWFAVPAYTALTGTNFTIADAMTAGSIGSLVVFVLITGLFSGLFPALSLARHDPATVIKGVAPASHVKRLTRSGVTVVQFGFSTALILLALAITLQIRYLNTMDVGFNKDDLLLLTSTYNAQNPDAFNFEAMINELGQHPGVAAVTRTNSTPPGLGALNPWRLPSWAPEESRSVRHIVVGENYLDVMELRLLAGRWFSPDFAADFVPLAIPQPGQQQPVPPELPPLMGVVITRTAAASYGLGTPTEALDKQFLHGGGPAGPGNYRVIGVVEDFRMSGGLEDPLSSIMMIRATQTPVLGGLLLRIDPTQTEAALAHIDAVWQKYRPDLPIDRRFFRQTYNDIVDAETRGINIAAIFASIISIVISAFGLYALAFYSTQRRTKEVGVRKVLGATSKKIIRLLTWDFLKPVMVACVVASIGGYFAIDYYFQQFSSRTEVPWLVYLAVTAGTLLVAALTVATQCYRAAKADPVRSLRYE
jgi:putative ABC transport system permease protein